MRALVIDDSKPVRSILERMFRECGFDVTLASDGCEALERLADGELPDVVTVNWNMPVLDGVDFLHAVRDDARYRHLRSDHGLRGIESAENLRGHAVGSRRLPDQTAYEGNTSGVTEKTWCAVGGQPGHTADGGGTEDRSDAPADPPQVAACWS